MPHAPQIQARQALRCGVVPPGRLVRVTCRLNSETCYTAEVICDLSPSEVIRGWRIACVRVSMSPWMRGSSRNE